MERYLVCELNRRTTIYGESKSHNVSSPSSVESQPSNENNDIPGLRNYNIAGLVSVYASM